jgi:hypothetical protein
MLYRFAMCSFLSLFRVRPLCRVDVCCVLYPTSRNLLNMSVEAERILEPEQPHTEPSAVDATSKTSSYASSRPASPVGRFGASIGGGSSFVVAELFCRCRAHPELSAIVLSVASPPPRAKTTSSFFTVITTKMRAKDYKDYPSITYTLPSNYTPSPTQHPPYTHNTMFRLPRPRLILLTLPVTVPSALLLYETAYAQINPNPAPLPNTYVLPLIQSHFIHQPFSIIKRISSIGFALAPYAFTAAIGIRDIRRQNAVAKANGESDDIIPKETLSPIDATIDDPNATALKETLQHLGPLFIKFGQQLSIRPDLIPPSYIPALRSLCDSCISSEEDKANGIALLKEELGLDNLYAPTGPFHEPLVMVASASLGQVFKVRERERENHHAHTHTPVFNSN